MRSSKRQHSAAHDASSNMQARKLSIVDALQPCHEHCLARHDQDLGLEGYSCRPAQYTHVPTGLDCSSAVANHQIWKHMYMKAAIILVVKCCAVDITQHNDDDHANAQLCNQNLLQILR